LHFQGVMKLFISALALHLAIAPSVSAESVCLATITAAPISQTDIAFSVRSEGVEEYSIRQGGTAAHIYIDAKKSPYLFFAFPAGNSGLGVWFKSNHKTSLTVISKPIVSDLGVEVQLKASTSELRIDDALLGSMRFIRDRELNAKVPHEIRNETTIIDNGTLTLQRKSINGLVDYRLELIPLSGTRIEKADGKMRLVSPREVRFKIRGFSSEPALTPMAAAEVFQPEYLAAMDPQQLKQFLFLFYKEKLAAGSPRYFTNFGRDRLITLSALMHTMQPQAVELLLKAILGGSHPTKGWMSHEQHEGDFASAERRKAGVPYVGVNATIEDYKMVDDDFLFPIVFANYAKLHPQRVVAFLNGKDHRGFSLQQLISNNFQLVTATTAAFAKDPIFQNLISLREGETTGQWRDSDWGLGGGIYPFDVNAALVPGALNALSELYNQEGPLFRPDKAELARTAFLVWNSKTLPLFEVRIGAQDLPSYGKAYLRQIGDRRIVPPPEEDLVFPAIALDARGGKIPIMHSDDSLMMAFGFPTKGFLYHAAQRVRLRFPYGLNKGTLLVANPVFAPRALQERFTPAHYHGLVSWPMQEDLWIIGSERQLQSRDFSVEERAELLIAQQEVRRMVAAKASHGRHEVFAIDTQDAISPFDGDALGNSNQLWSHLRLPGSRRH
jgi:hypothetical protein